MRGWMFCSVCIYLFIHSQPPAAVLEVGPDKPYGIGTIAEALRAASPGDTVLVQPGIYVEGALSLKQGMTLAGVGPGNTVIAYNGYMSQGYILSCRDGVLIRGCWLVCAGDCAVLGFRDVTFELQNCVIWGNKAVIRSHSAPWRVILTNCTVSGGRDGVVCENGVSAVLRNTIVYGNTSSLVGDVADISARHCNIEGGWPGEGNIDADPMFVSEQETHWGLPWPWPWPPLLGAPGLRTDLRLRPGSPCIDAGDNDAPALPETDIAGMHRIMYGGKSLTMDMGAYEYYINELRPGPRVEDTTLTWSSLAGKAYLILYSDDLLTWHLGQDLLPSAGDMTTFWTDDGSKTGVPPSLAPRRFYRILENP